MNVFSNSDVLYANMWIKASIKHAVKIDLGMQVKEWHGTVVAVVRGRLQCVFIITHS